MSGVRVVQVDAGREWRGGQNQVRLLARELSHDPGVEQRLVTRAAGPLAIRAAADGVAVVGVPWGPGLDPRAAWRLRSLVRAFRPHVLHAHDSHALTIALVARSLAGVRSPRSVAVATRRVDFHVRARSAWHRADHVVAISDAVRRVHTIDRRECRQSFEQRFSVERMARDYVRVYENVMASDPFAPFTEPPCRTSFA